MKRLIKLLALQRPRDNAVYSNYSKNRYINYYMCTIASVKNCMCYINVRYLGVYYTNVCES